MTSRCFVVVNYDKSSYKVDFKPKPLLPLKIVVVFENHSNEAPKQIFAKHKSNLQII